MKILCVLFVVSFFIRTAAGQFKVPASVFRIEQFEEAVKEAVEQRKALAIMASDEDTDANGTVGATEEGFKELAGWTVTVFVAAGKGGKDVFQLPPPLVTAIIEGVPNPAPELLIGPPSADEVWSRLHLQPKMDGKGFRKSIKGLEPGLKAKAAAYFKDKTPPPLVLPGDKQLAWCRIKGTYYLGKFDKLESEKLHLVDADGKKSGPIDLKELKPATQRYARLLAGAAGTAKTVKPDPAPSVPAPAPAAVVENWQNKDGKIIRAAFVALKDNMVTIRTDAGKEFTLPLESLALTSQVRARELEQAGKKR